MLDGIVVGLTGLIAILALWMSAGLLTRQAWRLENLASIGFISPRWASAFGMSLLASVAALIAGWWVRPVGIAGIIVVKVFYVLMLIGYRRAGLSRQRDAVNVAMTAHSVASLVVILSW